MCYAMLKLINMSQHILTCVNMLAHIILICANMFKRVLTSVMLR